MTDPICLSMLEAIRRCPEDATRRLILADRLEELGEDSLAFAYRWSGWYERYPHIDRVEVRRGGYLEEVFRYSWRMTRLADAANWRDAGRAFVPHGVYASLSPHYALASHPCGYHGEGRSLCAFESVPDAFVALGEALNSLKQTLLPPVNSKPVAAAMAGGE